jgi:hypothetical protein
VSNEQSDPTSTEAGNAGDSTLDPEAVTIWYDEVLLARQEVLNTLDELRSRTGVLLTVVALITTLFATLGTRTKTPIGQRPIELAALALFGVVIILLGLLIVPIFTWRTFARPGRVRRLVTGCQPKNATEVKMALAMKIPGDIRKDRDKLWRLQWIFVVALGVFVAEIICWVLGVLS